MNINSSLVTDTGRNVTEASVDAYRDKIAAHNDNDFVAHTAIQLYQGVAFYEAAPTYDWVAGSTLRVLLTTQLGADVACAFPALVQPGIYVPTGSVPVILRQPVATSVKVGGSVTFSVYAASATLMVYQWQKNNVDIVGANSADYMILNVQLSDAGNYRCLVRNTPGTTTSSAAALTVTTT